MNYQPLLERLYAELEKLHHACVRLMEDELYDVVEHTHRVLYNEPTECDLASVEIRSRGGEISIAYDAGGTCASGEEEDAEEASDGKEEQCLGEAERIARLTLEEYRRLMAKWAEELGAHTEEELKRDGLNFLLTIRIAPTAHITPS